jgi:hypothetical protein
MAFLVSRTGICDLFVRGSKYASDYQSQEQNDSEDADSN